MNPIKMSRDPAIYPQGPHTANVHPEEVQNFLDAGWVEGEGRDINDPAQMTRVELEVAARRNFDMFLTMADDSELVDTVRSLMHTREGLEARAAARADAPAPVVEGGETNAAGTQGTGTTEAGSSVTETAVVWAETEGRHRGGGSWSIMAGDTELVEGVSKEEAKAFNGLSPEDKQAWVAGRKAAPEQA